MFKFSRAYINKIYINIRFIMIKPSKTFIIITSIILLFFTYSFIESKLIEYKKIEINNKQIPETFNNFKIIFISDLHKRIYSEPLKIKKVIEKINSQNPDLVILGGDYVNYNKKDIIIFEELKNLKAKYGVFGVYGNHDTKIRGNTSSDYFNSSNIKNLNNNSYWIQKDGEKIKLGGVGDLWTDKQDLPKTTSDLLTNNFSILVSHNPDYIEEIKNEDKIDLVLSGHTHGGQANIFNLFQPLNPSIYGYLSGLYRFENKELYITRGIGEFFGPFRFFARPEISELILKSE